MSMMVEAEIEYKDGRIENIEFDHVADYYRFFDANAKNIKVVTTNEYRPRQYKPKDKK